MRSGKPLRYLQNCLFQVAVLFIFLLSPIHFASAEEVKSPRPLFISSSTQTALIELYTAEGCSSCPTADGWLSSLKDQGNLWTEIVPVALHVDYWDKLGWKDPYASKDLTARQNLYSQRWRTTSVYTPAIVLNGVEWNGWARHSDILWDKKEVGTLSVQKTTNKTQEFEIIFTPTTFDGTKNFVASAALVGFDLKSKVLDGENKGKLLVHDFTAITFKQKKMDRLTDSFRSKIPLSAPVNIQAPKLGIVVWVSLKDDPTPVQAVGGYLEP